MSDAPERESVIADQTSTAQINNLAWIPVSTAMLLALMAPALWNGFPLIFPDIGGYLDRPIYGTLGMGRSALYGLFLYAGSPFLFWPNVVLQSSLMLWLIVLTIRAHGLAGRQWLAFGIIAMLTVCTSLPWFSGQLMPDILFPAAVLSIYLLSFRSDQVALWEQFILCAVIALAAPSHMASAGMCVAVIGALWLLTRFERMKLLGLKLWPAASAVALGIALCPISNFAITGNFAFTPGGSSFLFGRLVEDGIVARYLEDRCPDTALRLCDYRAILPKHADDWLWSNNSPFRVLDWEHYPAEQRRITEETLHRYPLLHVTTAITAAIKQFVAFKTEIEVHNNEPTALMFRDHFPGWFSQFMAARQQTERFDVGPLNYLHVPVATLSLTCITIAVFFRRRLNIRPDTVALSIVILLALAANALICGIFSHPVDRYQGRLVLLAPLAFALIIAQHRKTLPL